MKNLIILCCLLCMVIVSAEAQTTSPKPKTTTPISKPKAKTTAPIKRVKTTTPVVKSKTAIVQPTPQKEVAKSETKTRIATVKETKQKNMTESYKTAIGLKFIYGVSLTGKFFINKKGALEAIVRYNNAGGFGSNIALTGLYLQHNEINAVDGLRWYYGGGGYINHFSWADKDVESVNTFGIACALGLKYKFKNFPIAISADWLPSYEINQNLGISAQNGGLGIKYTF